METVITIQQKVVDYHYVHSSHFKIKRNHLKTSVCFQTSKSSVFCFKLCQRIISLFVCYLEHFGCYFGHFERFASRNINILENCTVMELFCEFDVFFVSSKTTACCSFSEVSEYDSEEGAQFRECFAVH